MLIVDPGRTKTATATGVLPVIHWRTPQGIRRSATSTDKTLNVACEAECNLNPVLAGGINRVVYTIYVDGNEETSFTMSGRSLQQPNYTTGTAINRQGYGDPNRPAPFYGFGMTLDLESLPPGRVEVEATAYTNGGDSYVHPKKLVIYNDTDGADRRPSNKTIYCSTAGTAGGAGTLGDPVDSPQRALGLGVANPAGSTAPDRDAGGLTIMLMTDFPSWGGFYGAPSWHTSGEWAVTVKSYGSRRKIRRVTEGFFTAPQDYIVSAGVGTKAKVIFEDVEFVGPGPTLFVNNMAGEVHDVNCVQHSAHWNGSLTVPSVKYYQDDGAPLSLELAGTATGYRSSWGLHKYGFSFGFADQNSAYDFKLEKGLGVQIHVNNNSGADPCYTVGNISGVRYAPNEVAGYVNSDHGGVVRGGADIQLIDVSPGVLGVQALTAAVGDIASQANELVGSTYWGLQLIRFPSYPNSGGWPVFQVLGVGYNSGLPYILLSNPGTNFTDLGVSGALGVASAIKTAKVSTKEAYNDLVHTDIIQTLSNFNGAMFAHIRSFDIKDCRSFVGDGQTLTRCHFKNLTDGSKTSQPGANECSFVSASMVDCTWQFVTWASPALTFSGTWTRLEFVDCVFGDSTNIPSGGTTFIRNCHARTGPAKGIAPTTGPWFKIQVDLPPFDISPLDANVWTGSNIAVAPDEYGFTL